MKIIFLIIVFFMTGISVEAKQADLAGSWYSDSADELLVELGGYLDAADVGEVNGDVVGVIVPHAGFRFSGPVAAYSYNAIKAKKPDKVIVVGFTHRRYFPGRISVFTDESFVTPLGRAVIDKELSDKFIAYDKNIQDIPEAFESENSVEMQIPFLQIALKDARLVLITLCDQRQDNGDLLADALYDILKDEENYVIVGSSDMSHYLRYDAANEKDADTIEVIEAFDPEAFYLKSFKEQHELACGYGSIYSVMSASKRLGASDVKVLNYANSGDTFGNKSKVVGYLSVMFVDQEQRLKTKDQRPGTEGEDNMFNEAQRKEALKIARDTIQYYLKTGKRLDVNVEDELFKQDMGAFVTLRFNDRLRGCIGHMVASEPFYLTVRDMAIAAATEDPRFPNVTLDELKNIDIEISALTPMRKIDDYNEIEIGKHGVMVRMGSRSGVYLPQVADETGWNREQFMNSLCEQKVGIPEDAWKTGECEIYVFTAEVFGE